LRIFYELNASAKESKNELLFIELNSGWASSDLYCYNFDFQVKIHCFLNPQVHFEIVDCLSHQQ